LTVILLSIVGQAYSQEFKTYYFSIFKIDIPSSWNMNIKNEFNKVFIAVSKQDSDYDFKENISLTILEIDQKQRVQYFLHILKDEIKKLKQEIIKEEVISWSPLIKSITYDYFINVRIRQIAYVLIIDKNVFLLMCSSTPDDFVNYKSLFDKIVKSIVLIN